MISLERLPFPFVRLSGALLCGLALLGAEPAGADEMSDATSAICGKIAPGAAMAFDAQDRDSVAAYYAARECRPVWVDEHGPTRAASRAIAEIRRAADWGLEASDFELSAVDQPKAAGRWTGEQTASADLKITELVLRYAHEAQGGRIPEPEKLLSSYLDREPVVASAAEVLAATTTADDPGAVLRSYQPQQEQFLKLKALLADLKSKADTVQDVSIAKRGPVLQEGVKDADVAILKKRFGLAAEGDGAQVFDAALKEAVKSFQAAQSLQKDGIVGPRTRAALAGGDTQSASAKIEAVIANMEEWRWMPRSLGDTYVFVNVPAFSIRLNDKGRTVFDERVIVGTPSTQTPIFSKEMTTIVLRPQWYLPDSIKLTALLSGRPLERQGYVIKRNGRVVSSAQVDWGRAKLSQYEIYQPAGDDNALGLVKLLFPNKHSVYLHDTPSKSLFNDPVRLFSHGCMRVRNPQELAQLIFDIDEGANAPDVKRLVRKGPMSNTFALNTPIPVHVGYFTVWVDADGEAHFYKDYYGHQQRITLALAGKWDEIDVGRDHLAAVDTSALKRIKTGEGSDDQEDFDSPMGLTGGSTSYKLSKDSVGDIIRGSLGF